jgi:hypothetical protein
MNVSVHLEISKLGVHGRMSSVYLKQPSDLVFILIIAYEFGERDGTSLHEVNMFVKKLIRNIL